MSDLPNDWKLYAAVAFHSMIPRLPLIMEADVMPRKEINGCIWKSIQMGLEMARAIEEKEDENDAS